MNTDNLKRKAQEAADAAKRFNRKPPMWFYIVLGIVVVFIAQALRHI